MNKITISKEPVDLWQLVDHLPDFKDEYEIWEDKFTFSLTTPNLEDDFVGGFVGYVEPRENKEYNYEYASGRYTLSAYTPEGELLQKLDHIADKLVRWAGLHKLPFVGYAGKAQSSFREAGVWIIIPKSEEQLLSCVANFYKSKKKSKEAPNIVGLEAYLKKSLPTGKVTNAASFVSLRVRQMEGKERLTASKKNLEEFRAAHSDFTDERITSIVESMYPNQFASHEVAEEVIKELYKEGLPLTEESFKEVLSFLYDERRIVRYHLKTMEAREAADGVEKLIAKIYEDAVERTTYLSQYPEYNEKVKQYLEKLASQRGKTLAQTLYSLLNVLAMKRQTNDVIVQGNYLTFHCYAEPNGDVIFTKDRRTRADYDEDGKPIRRETQAPEPKAEPTPERKPEPEEKKGCLGSILFVVALIIIFSV